MKHHRLGCRYGKDSQYKWKYVDCASCLKIKKRGSVGQEWKKKRDLVIRIVCANGVSTRFAADVFDLPHSRISAIVKKSI